MKRFHRSQLSVAGGALLALSLVLSPGCGGGGDIQAGVGAAGVKLGDDRAAVERVLGTPEREQKTSPSSPATQIATYLLYPSRGLDLLLEDGTVRTLFLYQEGIENHQKYMGTTSEGLGLDSTREQVLARLGEPSVRGLAETAELWYRYDSGIEFGFEANGTVRLIVLISPR